MRTQFAQSCCTSACLDMGTEFKGFDFEEHL